MYKKEGRMKKVIDDVADLHELIVMANKDVFFRIIRLLFDVLHDFLYPKDNKNKEEVFVEKNDSVSLLCFGGFLFLTDDLLKGIRYFVMLFKNESIDSKLKLFIHCLLVASYSITKEKELALKSIQIITEMFQLSTAQYIPAWFQSFIASSYITIDNSNQQLDHIVKKLEPLINQEQSDNTVNEKLRLVHLKHICFQKENFLDALNYC